MGAFYSQRVRARTLGFLLIGIAAVALLIVALPHSPMVREEATLIFAPLVLVAGLGIVAGAARIGDTGLRVAVVAAIVLVALANYFLGPAALVPVTFTWLALYVFAFFRRLEAMAYMVAIGISFAVVLTEQQVTSPLVRWILGIGTPLVAGLLLSMVVRLAMSRTAVLQDSERQTRAIIESAPNAFFTVDGEGVIMEWNREAERMFGIEASEAVGSRTLDVVILPGDREGHLQRLAGAFQGSPDDPPLRSERDLMRKGGQSFFAEVTLSLVEVEEQRSLLVFVRDLSDRQEREREREQLYREQAARQEAEHMAAMVHGLQMLLDAALAHGRLEQILEVLVPRLCEVLQAESASIFLTDEETGQLVLRASTGGLPEEPMVAEAHHFSAQVAASRSGLLVHDPPPENLVDPAQHGVSSLLAVPLTAGDEVTGVIQVGVPPPRRFDDDNLLMLGLAADRVALAIDHSLVFEREHRIAETLQRSLLPERLPVLPGLEVAARYIPAASEAEVGGDWYDVIPIDSSRVGLVMGDIAGKGLAAAAMVGRLRSAMRAYALEGREPADVVGSLNQLVWSEVEDSEMATLVYVVVDPAEGTYTWVNAGHPPPLILAADGTTSFLEGPRSVPLGVMPFPTFEEGTAPVPEGSTLLLYTDGLVERPGELLDDGFDRLAVAARGADKGADKACDQVLAALVPTGAMADDVALLALHAPQLSERFTLELPPEPRQLSSMRALLRRWLMHADASEEDIASVLASVGEAAANAIEHAGLGSRQHFTLAGLIEDGYVELTIADPGHWRENAREERGRGVPLMRELMDDVDVSHSDQGTTVTLRRRLRVASDSASTPL
jgi:PAS domain S-box-containing protein